MQRGMKKRRRLFSILAMLLMFFSLITPAFAAGVTYNDLGKTLFNSSIKPENKLSQTLLEQFKDEEKVTFLVKFKEKADVAKVAIEARQQASLQNLSPQQTKFLQRSAVVSELRTTSLESQRNVKTFLEEKLKTGE